MERQRLLIDHGCTLLVGLPDGIAKVRVKDEDLEVDQKFCMCGLT